MKPILLAAGLFSLLWLLPLSACAGSDAFHVANWNVENLYDLSQAYSSFYQNVPFLKAEAGLRESRVRLCDLAAKILRHGLSLLGIDTPERI